MLNKGTFFYIISLIFLLALTQVSKAQNAFTIHATQSSFFALNKEGMLSLDAKGLPYQGSKEIYIREVEFSKKDTAFFVIDPWDNMPVASLNTMNAKVTQDYILPLIKAASKKTFLFMFLLMIVQQCILLLIAAKSLRKFISFLKIIPILRLFIGIS